MNLVVEMGPIIREFLMTGLLHSTKSIEFTNLPFISGPSVETTMFEF